MNDLVSLEVNHERIKYDSIEVFDTLKNMIVYLEGLPNFIVRSSSYAQNKESLYRCEYVEIYDRSEPYLETERRFLRERQVKKVDEVLMGYVYFSSRDEEARIDEQIVIEVKRQKYLKPLSKIADDFAEEFNVKVLIKY